MNKSFITAISYYLPEEIRTNEDISKIFPDFTVEKIANKIGISKRHISASSEFSSDMAYHATKKLFKEHSINPDEIDFVLLCTQSPDYFLPTTACILQERLQLPTSAGALDFNLGCSGYVYGLALAKGLITASIAKNILLITSETYSKFIHHGDKGNMTIFGDAAAATLVSKYGCGGGEILDFILGTDGKGSEKLIVKNGGLRFPKSINDEEVDEFGNVKASSFLYMDGPAIFNFTSSAVPTLVNQVLAKHNLSLDEIDYFVFHQANKYMLNHIRKKLKIPEERFYICMEEFGNTVSSTIPIALYNLEKETNLKGKKVMLCGFGVGFSWGATILTY
jgi:3-oxoacyl-[acyl-carrier-protein] synthase-3